MFFSLTPIHLALLAGLVVAVPAQLSAQSQQEVSLRLLSFPRAANPEPVEILLADGRVMEVAVPTNEFSRAYTVPRMQEWIVGRTSLEAGNGDGFEELGRVTVLDSPSQILVLIRKGETYDGGFEVLALDDSAGGFSGGGFLFVNASGIDIAGDAADQPFAIAPGEHVIVDPLCESGETSFDAMFSFRTEDRVRPFFSSRWPVSERARALIFFYHDEATGRLHIHSIRDFLQP